MKEHPKISVIVPIYNAEKYLHRCIDSLLAQTFTDFEILLIDDGSTDNSGKICDEYAAQDIRVRVFHKENGGVSSARQLGIDKAKGEYSIHADPDDWVEPEMLYDLYHKALCDNADMVICDFYIDKQTGVEMCKQNIQECIPSNVFERLISQKLHGSCWNKLIRRECYKLYNVHFPSNIIRWEDLYVMCSLLMHPMKVCYLPKAYYHYDQMLNPNSIVRKPTMKGLNSQIYFISHFMKMGISDSLMYQAKIATKTLAYKSGLINLKDVVSLYDETNDKYLRENHSTDIYSFGLGLLLKGKIIEAYLLRFFYGYYVNIKQIVKRLIY